MGAFQAPAQAGIIQAFVPGPFPSCDSRARPAPSLASAALTVGQGVRGKENKKRFDRARGSGAPPPSPRDPPLAPRATPKSWPPANDRSTALCASEPEGRATLAAIVQPLPVGSPQERGTGSWL